METKRCSSCGLDLPEPDWFPSVWGSRKNGTWCRHCFSRYHKEKNAPASGVTDDPRPCRHCGLIYRPKTRNKPSIYCSRECKGYARRAKERADRAAAKPADRRCLHCDGAIPQSARSDAVFCSPECNSNAHQLKRKLRRRGRGDEDGYVRAEIARRDNYRCGICRKRVDMSLDYPDPMCASLDHVVPVAEGGTSEPANLRLTHLTCNVRRKHRGGLEQLALI